MLFSNRVDRVARVTDVDWLEPTESPYQPLILAPVDDSSRHRSEPIRLVQQIRNQVLDVIVVPVDHCDYVDVLTRRYDLRL